MGITYRKKFQTLLLLCLFSFLLLSLSCTSYTNSTTSGSGGVGFGWVVTVQPVIPNIPAGGSTPVQITVFNGAGFPVPDGTAVEITCTLGTINGSTKITLYTSKGKINVFFVAGSATGTATIAAYANGVYGAANITIS